MATGLLYESAQFEPLIDEPWVPARVEDAIAAIVSDADAAFDPDALWPAHEWDGWEEPLPLKALYVGAAGVIWALDSLRRRGHAETSLDLAAAALRTLELERAAPDFTADEHYHPASLLCGEAGPLLVAYRLASDAALADDVYALVRGNVANPTDDVSWGAPGTLLAALAMGEWTREPRWEEAARETATALRARRGDDDRSPWHDTDAGTDRCAFARAAPPIQRKFMERPGAPRIAGAPHSARSQSLEGDADGWLHDAARPRHRGRRLRGRGAKAGRESGHHPRSAALALWATADLAPWSLLVYERRGRQPRRTGAHR